MKKIQKITTQSREETQNYAEEVYKSYPKHKIWLLQGDLGSGKTTFVKGLAKALNLPQNQVKSPTFTVVAEFEPLVHYDLYRLDELDETLQALLEEHLDSQKYVLIEWPEKITLPVSQAHLKLHFHHQGTNQRFIELEAFPPLEG